MDAHQDRPLTQSIIGIKGITRRFAGIAAVDDVSLDIGRGEFFCLLGASGSGKTTLLRMIAGLDRPSGGRILIDGDDVTGLPPYRRPVNMMFQSYALFPHLTVEANVGFGLREEGRPKAEIRERVHASLDLLEMSAFAARDVERDVVDGDDRAEPPGHTLEADDRLLRQRPVLMRVHNRFRSRSYFGVTKGAE